jgi:hypothetical protein
MICEFHPFFGQLIYIWRLDRRLPVTAKVAVAKIVGQDEDDIGSIAPGCRRNIWKQGRNSCGSRGKTHHADEFSSGVFTHDNSSKKRTRCLSI